MDEMKNYIKDVENHLGQFTVDTERNFIKVKIRIELI